MLNNFAYFDFVCSFLCLYAAVYAALDLQMLFSPWLLAFMAVVFAAEGGRKS